MEGQLSEESRMLSYNFARKFFLLHSLPPPSSLLHPPSLSSCSLPPSLSAEGEFNHGVVLTSRPLKDDELFEVEIVEMVDKWAGSIEIGVTTHR